MFGDLLLTLGIFMKFRIIQKHDGSAYYYQVKQLKWGFWLNPSDLLGRTKYPITFSSCKDADEWIEGQFLKLTTHNIILERTMS